MKKFLLLLILPFLLYAEKVEITSDSFYARDMEKQVHFVDDVLVKQGKSWIHSDEVIVYFDDNNETIQYDAIGKATFEIMRDENHYKGRAEKITYYPKTSKYLFAGNAVIDDLINKRYIAGNTVVINTLTGEADVKGNNKKPVKFIFDAGKKK